MMTVSAVFVDMTVRQALQVPRVIWCAGGYACSCGRAACSCSISEGDRSASAYQQCLLPLLIVAACILTYMLTFHVQHGIGRAGPCCAGA